MQAHPSAMCTKMLLIPDGKSAEEQVWGTKIESEIWIDCICVSSKWKCVVIVSGAECGGLNRGNPAGSQGKMKLPEGQSIGRKGERPGLRVKSCETKMETGGLLREECPGTQ